MECQPHWPVGQGACTSLSASWQLHPAECTSAPSGSVMRRSHVSSLHTRRGLGGVGAEQAEQDCSGQQQVYAPNGNPDGCSAQPASHSK